MTPSCPRSLELRQTAPQSLTRPATLKLQRPGRSPSSGLTRCKVTRSYRVLLAPATYHLAHHQPPSLTSDMAFTTLSSSSSYDHWSNPGKNFSFPQPFPPQHSHFAVQHSVTSQVPRVPEKILPNHRSRILYLEMVNRQAATQPAPRPTSQLPVNQPLTDLSATTHSRQPSATQTSP